MSCQKSACHSDSWVVDSIRLVLLFVFQYNVKFIHPLLILPKASPLQLILGISSITILIFKMHQMFNLLLFIWTRK